MDRSDKKLDIQKELIVEIAGKAGTIPEKKIVSEAIRAVIHYIKYDLKKDVVLANEFSEMLETVLEGFGYHVKAIVKNGVRERKHKPKTINLNLQDIVDDNGNRYELFFFNSLANTMKQSLQQNPNILYISGLQECVKKILGVNKWNNRCKNLSEEIVNFARSQFKAHSDKKMCALLIK